MGASGRVLRSLINDTAGLDPADYFITNTVKYRPPGNRTPTWEEVAHSVPYLRREWSALGRPKVLVAVGASAFDALWPQDWTRTGGITKYAGYPREVKGGCTLWTMFHPAYGLRNAAIRPIMEQHWEKFGNWFREEFK